MLALYEKEFNTQIHFFITLLQSWRNHAYTIHQQSDHG